jgi:hypothetical protein
LVALGNGLLDGRGSTGALNVMANVLRAAAVGAEAENADAAKADANPEAAVTAEAAASADPWAALAAFQGAAALLPSHVGALHGLGAAQWVVGDQAAADGAWARAVAAFDADAARVKTCVLSVFVYYLFPLYFFQNIGGKAQASSPRRVANGLSLALET